MIQRVFIIFVAGTMGVAIYSLAWRYVAMGLIPSLALGSALIAVCSAAFGQKDYNKAKIGMNYAVKLALVVCIALSGFLILFADQLIILVTYSESMIELRPMLAWALRAFCIIIPFYAMINLGSSILQTVRKSKKATVAVLMINALKLALMSVACLYSYEAIFLALILSNVVGGIFMITWAYREVRKYGKTLMGPRDVDAMITP